MHEFLTEIWTMEVANRCFCMVQVDYFINTRTLFATPIYLSKTHDAFITNGTQLNTNASGAVALVMKA